MVLSQGSLVKAWFGAELSPRSGVESKVEAAISEGMTAAPCTWFFCKGLPSGPPPHPGKDTLLLGSECF